MTVILGTPAARSCIPHLTPLTICDKVVIAIMTTTHQKSHSSRTTLTISLKLTFSNSHTTSPTEIATGTR